MATAYAAFTSLMRLISDLHEHPHPPIELEEELFDSLNSTISVFQRFLQDHHASLDLALELRISDAARAAEDLIEAQIAADRALDRVDFDGSLRKAMRGMDLIQKEVMEMNWNTEKKSQGNNKPRQPVTRGGENTVVVGIEDLTLKIVDKLSRPHQGSGRQIVSITGMGGIGKTTLARKVYDHRYVTDYFHFRAWTTISKEYSIRESLVELLHCLDRTASKEGLGRQEEHELGLRLYQSLCDRRYLVVLDDLWDVEAWEKLRPFFPDSRGSGIVITTRESKFASISSHAFAVDFLDKKTSWELFCKTVFGQDGDCLRGLEDVGREISDKCRGLPLSVFVIGGHLAKSPRTREYWQSVAKNLSSIVNSEDDDLCLKILSLSYIHLPVHLKPCFLYMAIFPEDEDIDIEILIRQWVVEGFPKPIHGKSLEEAAKEYMYDLVGRNLIFFSTSSQMHDLLRDLCLKEALEKKFLRILMEKDPEVPNNKRRIVLSRSSVEDDHSYSKAGVLKSLPAVRTLVSRGPFLLASTTNESSTITASATRSWEISLNDTEEVTRQLVNLRYLLKLTQGAVY